MAAQTRSRPQDPVKQFSVFAENRVGRLYDLTTLLKDNNVHIMAITVLDTTDSSIIRVVVDDPDKARELHGVNNDFPYGECSVLAVEIGDESELKKRPGRAPRGRDQHHYVYSFIKRPADRSAWRSARRIPRRRRRRSRTAGSRCSSRAISRGSAPGALLGDLAGALGVELVDPVM
jgi:hypothetical protein